MKKLKDFTKLEHHELELKFDLTNMSGLGVSALLVQSLYRDFPVSVQGVKHVSSPDRYYRQGGNVMRFRAHPTNKGGELTVKLRTSKKSIANRVEVDVPLASSVGTDDIEAFLLATGWEQELKLYKTSIIIRVGSTCPDTFGERCPPVIIAYYAVSQGGTVGDYRTFLEVELDKDFLKSKDMADAELNLDNWHRYFMNIFPGFPKKALNKSLYELYTGKSYQVATGK